MIETPYIEQDCTFRHRGHEYGAGGCIVTDKFVVAYPGENGVLKDWHGNTIGTWRATATWKTPRSYMSGTMSQIEACVNGVRYTGRGAGIGMIYKGKRIK